jgi:hypothetical protein
MTQDNKSHVPERNETEESLHVERKKTDYELGKQHASMDRDSDAVVQQEREHPDDVLEKARERADRSLGRDVS